MKQKKLTGEQKKQIIEFSVDILEMLDTIETYLAKLDSITDQVNYHETVSEIFRLFHNIKGSAGFLAFEKLVEITHSIESMLQVYRKKPSSWTSDVTDLLIRSCDGIRLIVDQIQNHFHEKGLEKEVDVLLENLKTKLYETEQTDEADPSLMGHILMQKGAINSEELEEALDLQKAPLGNILINMGKISPEDVKLALHEQKRSQKEGIEATQSIKSRDIRISLEKLDELIDLVGELMITETRLSQDPSASDQLHRHIQELQDLTMSMRLVPIAKLFRKMIRVVRETAKKLGKTVDLQISGEKTEVDKTLIEQITDPLIHLVRNAIDHGLETPEERKLSGKSPGGKILLEANQIGNDICIRIQDDGKGLNREKILSHARKKGILGSQETLSEEEVWRIIFQPGFSTSEKISHISGRGIGMDVVQKHIKSLHGNIDIHSLEGKGTTFIIKIPLTLTILDSLLMQVGNTSYALPISTIRETLQPKSTQITKTMDNKELITLRQELLPVIRLHKVYSLETEVSSLEKGMLLVIDHPQHPFCLFVDAIIIQQQIVVKSLPPSMKRVPHLSGCTILGDGQVGLILDVSGLAASLES